MEIEIPWEVLLPYESKALKTLSQHADLPGFRKGHVPEKILRDRVGDGAIIEDMADLALKDIYPEIVDKENINGIGRPSVVITKIARDNPVSVKITTAVVPKAELPDYKKIAKEILNKNNNSSINVNEEEINKFIEELRKNYAKASHSYSPDHKHDEEHKDEELVLPEVNDEFVKKLGNFESVNDFKTKLKENLISDKQHKAKEKRRIEILEKILEKTKIEIPEILVEGELDRMLSQFQGDIEKSGIKFEDYLKHVGKTAEDMRKEWHEDASKRSAMQIIIAEIAIKEKIIPPEEKIKEHYDTILQTYKDADPFKVKMYVEQQLTNELVFEFLENHK